MMKLRIEEVPEEELALADSHYLLLQPVIKETSSLTSMKFSPLFSIFKRLLRDWHKFY